MSTFSTLQMRHCKWVGFWMRTKHCVRVSLNNLYPAVSTSFWVTKRFVFYRTNPRSGFQDDADQVLTLVHLNRKV